VVDGVPFATPRGPFHWQRIADARFVSSSIGSGVEFAIGRHDGYGFPVSRAVLSLGAHGWLIVDCVSAPRPVRVDAWWHLHPAWSASPDDGGFALQHASGRRLALASTAAERTMEMQPFSPEYGQLDHAIALRTAVSGAGPLVMATYLPGAIGTIRSRVRLAEVDEAMHPGWTACVVAIAGDADLRVSVAFPGEPEPDVKNWPQPCIQEVRAVCVE
jgi:hypothetical protein